MLRGHRRFIVLCYTAKPRGFRGRAEMLYRVAFEGANLTKVSLVMATAGWPTICCSRCCGSMTRIVRVTVVAAAGFG
jgi:hypothetical protein